MNNKILSYYVPQFLKESLVTEEGQVFYGVHVVNSDENFVYVQLLQSDGTPIVIVPKEPIYVGDKILIKFGTHDIAIGDIKTVTKI